MPSFTSEAAVPPTGIELAAMSSWVIIIRAIHCRGGEQDDALIELDRRRLWLTETQKIDAGLASARVH